MDRFFRSPLLVAALGAIAPLAFAQGLLTQTIDLKTYAGPIATPNSAPPLPLPASGFSVIGAAYDPGNTTLYVADHAQAVVYLVNPQAGTVLNAVTANSVTNSLNGVLANPVNHNWAALGSAYTMQFNGATFVETDVARSIHSSGAWDPSNTHIYGTIGGIFNGVRGIEFVFYSSLCGGTTASNDNAVAINPLTHRVYVTCASFLSTGAPASGGLAMYDGLNDKTITSNTFPNPNVPIALTLYGRQAGGIAVNPNTNKVYLSAASSATTLDVVDASTYALLASIPGLPDQSGKFLGGVTVPRPVVINTATNTIFVLNSINSTISVFNGRTNALTGVITVPAGVPVTVAAGAPEPNPGNSYLSSDGSLTSLTGAIAMAINEVENVLYVASVDGTIRVYALDPPTAPAGYSVSGTIRNALGVASAGVTVNASGTTGKATAVTDGNGFFVLGDLPAGVYNITPVPGGSSFAPSFTSVSVGNQNVTGLTFQQNPPVTPGSYTLSPWTMVGPGVVTTGTVTLNQPAPAGGAIVTLSASDPKAAKVPSTVTVPAGQNSVLFNVQGSGVGAPTNVTLNAAYNGGSASTTLTVAPGDKLSIQTAAYSNSNGKLFVNATSTSSVATLQVFLSSNNQFVGTMINLGSGSYTLAAPLVLVPGASINVVSNLGGKTGQGVFFTF